MTVSAKAAVSPLATPQVGDPVYLPTEGYISHGRDDFQGGLCTVSEVKEDISAGQPAMFISVTERPGHYYNWNFLAPRQEDLRKQYGSHRGRPDPDYSPEFNEPSSSEPMVLVVENPNESTGIYSVGQVKTVYASSYPLTGWCSDQELAEYEPGHYAILAQEFAFGSEPYKVLMGLQEQFVAYRIERGLTPEPVSEEAASGLISR
jgi:hypothetical protein